MTLGDTFTPQQRGFIHKAVDEKLLEHGERVGDMFTDFHIEMLRQFELQSMELRKFVERNAEGKLLSYLKEEEREQAAEVEESFLA